MGIMSVRELNANVSQALARVEAGEFISITKHGKAVAELRPARPVRDQAWHDAYARMIERMEKGIGLPPLGTITYEDKHGPHAL